MRTLLNLHLLAASLFTFSARSQDAPPPNDNWENAAPIQFNFPSANYRAPGTTTGATRQEGEPVHPQGSASVWFKWTPTFSGIVLATFPDSGGDHSSGAFYVANGPSVSDLVPAPAWDGRLIFTAGETYYLGMFSAPEKTGAFELVFWIQNNNSPQNDEFENATELQLTNNAAKIAGTTLFATSQPGEPPNGGASVWFKWTPLLPGEIECKLTSGSGEIEIFSGTSLSSLTPVMDNFVFPGSTYHIRVSFEPTRGQRFELSLRRVYEEAAIVRPANDNFVDATPIFGEKIFLTGDFGSASSEPGEPGTDFHFPNQSLWWKFSVPAQGDIVAYTDASAFYAIHRGGNSFETLEEIWSVSGSWLSFQSETHFSVQPGEVYYFQLDVPPEVHPPAALHVHFRTSLPENDNFENAQPLDSFGAVRGFNGGATSQPGEPALTYGTSRTIWYSWQAPADGTVRFLTDWTSQFSLGIYRGTDLNSLVLVAETRTTTVASVEAGEVLYLQVDGPVGVSSVTVPLSVQAFIPAHAPNDSFAEALTAFDKPASLDHATLEAGEPAHAPYPHKSLWWHWVANQSGRITIAAGASEAIAVYEGDSIETLRLLGRGSDGVAICDVRMGYRYYLAISAPSDATGTTAPRVNQFDLAPNSEFDSGNLVLNGSFERSNLPPWTIDGHRSERTSIGRFGVPHGWDALSMPAAPGAVGQVVMVEPNKAYRLRFNAV